jgi:hypothetical protein
MFRQARLSGTMQTRSFTSRHVPGVVEELANNLATNPNAERHRQLHGLLSHLKQASSGSAERQKQAMATDCELLVPEEYDQLLRAEFERRCSFGERCNTEFMISLKWKKMLQDCGIVHGLHGFDKGYQKRPPNTVALATADVVFHKALRDGEYGSKRLTYELFCKALLLIAQHAYPDLEDAAALAEVLSRIAGFVTRTEENQEEPQLLEDLSLDANVVMTLDNFKFPLHDLFYTVCQCKLENPMQAKPGLGTVRKRERTYLKYSEMQGSTRCSGSMTSMDRALASHLFGSSELSSCRASDSTCEPESCKGLETLRTGSEQSDVENELNSKAIGLDKAKLFETERDEEWEAPLADEDGHPREEADLSVDDATPQREAAQQHRTTAMPSHSFFRNTLGHGVALDDTQVSLVNGTPTIRDRCRRMSSDQMMLMCRRLGVYPDLISRPEVYRIFKRAQHTGYSQGTGSSIHGYLTFEEFVDAVGQLALKAYSQQPFSEEYVEAHEKVEAFLLRMLPFTNSRTLRSRFLDQVDER